MNGARGFTLIELLIAITLLGLLMVMLTGGLRLGTRAWDVGETRLANTARLQATQDFIRRSMTQAHPIRLEDDDEEEEALAFMGESETLSFVTLMPPQFAAAGFAWLTFALADNEADGADLVVDWREFDPDADDFAGEAEPRRSILMPNVAGVAFDYYGDPEEDGDDPQWETQWEPGPRLPDLVRMNVTFPDGDDRVWPDLLIAPLIDARPTARR